MFVWVFKIFLFKSGKIPKRYELRKSHVEEVAEENEFY